MNKLANIGMELSKVTGRTGLILQKHSPEILLAVGVVGIVGSTVLACRATLKVEEVLDKANFDISKNKHARETMPKVYSEEDYKKDMTKVYTDTGFEFVKLYGPAVTLGVASIGCVVGAQGILRKRNVALMAAYKAVEEGFSAYRKRVVDEYGEDKDYMYKNGLKSEQVTEVEVDENGKAKNVKTEKFVTDPNGLSVYARYFDDKCREWSPVPEYNLLFLKAQQNYANDMLHARGHILLNEIYDQLGIPRSEEGTVVGWAMGNGDDFVDFGIFNGDDSRSRDFVNGYDSRILLDFNVDGLIYKLIEKKPDELDMQYRRIIRGDI